MSLSRNSPVQTTQGSCNSPLKTTQRIHNSAVHQAYTVEFYFSSNNFVKMRKTNESSMGTSNGLINKNLNSKNLVTLSLSEMDDREETKFTFLLFIFRICTPFLNFRQYSGVDSDPLGSDPIRKYHQNH